MIVRASPVLGISKALPVVNVVWGCWGESSVPDAAIAFCDAIRGLENLSIEWRRGHLKLTLTSMGKTWMSLFVTVVILARIDVAVRS